MGELSDRRLQTVARIETLRDRLVSAESIAKGKASVFATGSFGRCEASIFSDLDLFIVGKKNGKNGTNGTQGSLLPRLDEIRIKSELIEVTKILGIPDFDGDGAFLKHFSVHEFTKSLGTREDDVTNTFTARLLLLLESCPLVGTDVYGEITEEVINVYWRDYEDHKNDFIPAFLANDILRLWRTFCVNYEARTQRNPSRKKAEGKLKNYKLKHSRMLTCYSALLYFLAVFKRNGTVRPSDALEMIGLTPTQRLEWLLEQSYLKSAHPIINNLLSQYEIFLSRTNAKKNELVRHFMSVDESRKHTGEAYQFGDLMFKALGCGLN